MLLDFILYLTHPTVDLLQQEAFCHLKTFKTQLLLERVKMRKWKGGALPHSHHKHAEESP